MATTRLGLYGGPRSPYGSFVGKTQGKSYTQTFTRLGLYGGSRYPYGDFSGKVSITPEPPVVEPPIYSGGGAVSAPGAGGGGFVPYRSPSYPTREPFPDEFFTDEDEDDMIIALCAAFVEIMEWPH